MKAGLDYVGVGVFALIFNKEGEVLLVNHKLTDKKPKDLAGCWSMPGGTVEFGETCLKALRREIKEELGMKIYDEKLINYNEWTPKGRHWTGINFQAKTKDTPKILEPEKIKEAKFFKTNNLPQNLSGFCRECLEIISRKYGIK